MERFVGVDDARSSLGRLVEEVAASGDVVSLTERGKALAQARSTVSEAGLDVGVIDEAITAARRL